MTEDLRQLAMIWAQSTSGVIGRDNGIPWHLPEDQARFKQLTVGQTVIMGRLTWESLPARVRPLPGRRNVVITRDPGYIAEGAEVLTGLDDVFRGWVIGGAQIYAQALPFAVRCEVTEIDIDTDEDLAGRFGWDVPVVLLNGRQHSFHRVDRDRLSRALEALGA